ncbi:arsenate reductase/protein-tyrosine-phosphatase family protein [Geodermatophilus marinus]|uniref:arsenate reductase/protein-tyrosine-phosphatase family protein n=1 Tax=Geodermatophilus sp. LHW52908 TaxID=2303986 RepID=UPI000E3BBC2F|nr:low molecular weight phosphatase family protein [Geodermatophilus sp. LHW52908]RFU22798.1 low molecular weight phosphatase family protein [Geodermatophilus sp. LHW52908]
MSRLLVVCRGNVCRSRAAEHLLRAGLAGTGITVGSAGTHALAGAPADPLVVAQLRARGVDVPPAPARQLDRAALRAADVVVVMTAAQRSAVVAVDPAAVRRTFPLRQLARLLATPGTAVPGADAAERLLTLPALLAARRSARPPDGGEDVEDPYGRDAAVTGRVVAQIEDAVQGLVGALLQPAPPGAPAPGRTPGDVDALRGV